MSGFLLLAARRLLAALLMSTLLAACGGGGGGGGGGGAESVADPGIAGSPYFPLSVGSRWRTDEQGSQVVSFVSGTQTIDGTAAQVMTTVEGGVSFTEYFVKSEAGVKQIPGPESDEFTRQIGPIDMVRFPLRTGSSYVAVDKALPPSVDIDGDGRLDPLSVKLDVTVVGFERVVLPVGSFDNCLHLRSVSVYTWTLSSNNQRVLVTVTGDEWFAADVGLLKSSTQTSSGTRTERSESTLVTYKVGGNRGNAGQPAPTVSSIVPSGPAAVGPNTALVLNFSDDIDPASVGSSNVRVTGPGGSTLAGAISWTDARTLKFMPNTPWTNGGHSVSLLAGPSDLFGVPVTPSALSAFLVDAAAPAVEALTPVADSLGVTAQISVRFSEAMDRAVQPVLTVTGPGGVALAGTVGWQDERTLAVVAFGPLASGTYTANLASGAVDLVGNAMTTATRWRFTIDASGPTLVNTAPANGAEDVPLSGELRVTFDEPIAPGSVTAATAGLYKNSVQVPTALRVEGSTVVLTPTLPLLRGVVYAVRLGSGVTDSLGNALPQAVEVQFASESGRFALPKQLPALGAGNVVRLALADLNADGIKDLLVAQRDEGPVGRLLMIPGRPDGTLAGSSVQILGPSRILQSMAVADLTGDGANDVAVNSAVGGPKLLVQRSDGSFQIDSLEFGNVTGSEVAPIALSGSSRPGLVDLAEGAQLQSQRTLRLWRPATSGGLQAFETLTTGSSFWPIKLAVGDVNGDGRQDVVTLASDLSSRAIVTWIQRADGGFDLQTRAAPSASGFVLAVGDFDGDGRQDVMVSEGDRNLRILRQTSTGALETGELIVLPYMASSVQVLDYNGDGRLDVVVLHDLSDFNTTVRISVLLRQASGGYAVTNPFDFDELPLFPARSDFLVADLTGDGRLDFLVGQLLIRQKAGASASAVQPSPKQPSAAPRKRVRMPSPLVMPKSM